MMDAAEALSAWFCECERARFGRYARPDAPARVAMLIADGVKAEPIAMTSAALIEAGADPLLLAPAKGTVRSIDGQEFEADAALDSVEPETFDALVLPDGDQAVTRLLQDERSVRLINTQCRLRHPIFVGSASVRMLDAAGLTASSRAPDRGFTIGAIAHLPDNVDEFVSAVRLRPVTGETGGLMPNRKTFDDREKYDHSQHSTSTPEKGDLGAVPGEERPRADGRPDPRGPGATSKQTRKSR